MTDSERRQRIESICDAALNLPGAERAEYLTRACGDDGTLRAEVELLLAHASGAEHFLEIPVGAIVASLATDAQAVGPGTKLGTFELLRPLGAGGQGHVFRARDTQLHRDVAVKMLTGPASGDAVTREALLREARQAAQLSHSGICQVFHVGESPHGPFMVMELVDGETLRDLLRAGPMSMDRVCRIGAEIARALDHSHAHGIVHRDLKSANVMLTRDGHVKVLDFGIAATLPDDSLERTLSMRNDREIAGIAGTVPYMAPEVLCGSAAGVASDIWALGVVLYEMATSHLPFDRETPSELVASILRDPPAPLPGPMPAPIAQLISRCLTKDPIQRPARAGEIALALEIAPAALAPTRSSFAWSGAPRSSVLAAGAVVVSLAVWLTLSARRDSLDQPQGSFRLQKAVQITSATGVEEHPALSPDGRTIAYSASPSGVWGNDWDIWVTQPGGTPVNRTADYAGKDLFPSWSPDGTQIAFWSDRDGGGCYVMPAIGGAARRVAVASFYDANPPVWSRDAGELSCVVGDPYTVELVTFAVASGEPLRRWALPAEGRRLFVAPAPDWRRVAMIVAAGGLSDDLTRLVLLNLGTGKAEEVTDGQTNVWSPAWSPDGSSLFYVSNAGGSSDVWRQRFDEDGKTVGEPVAVSSGVGMRNLALSRDGDKLVWAQGRKVANLWRVPILADRRATWADAMQITFDQAFVEFADLSSDGRLAVSSDRAGSFNLWVLPSAGGEMRPVTSDRGAEFAPRWSPDDLTFVFYSAKSGNRDIYTIPVIGGAWKQLTTNPSADLIPNWSPNGREVVHMSDRGSYAAVWVTPAAGGEGREIARTVSPGNWSPDGQQIAFGLNQRLVRRSATGKGEIVQLSQMPAWDGVWAPDGARLYFVRADRIGDLYTVRADGSDERPLTDLMNRRGTLVANSLASDGRYLYFSWQEDLGDIWVADLLK